MTSGDLMEALANHRMLGSAPASELEWLATHGRVRLLAPGDVLSHKGEPVSGMFVVLSGHLTMHQDRGSGVQKMIEWRGGEVTGLLPYSRLVAPPGDSIAETATTLLEIPRDLIPAVISECHSVTSILVHAMVDRARVFTSSSLLDAKLVSVGKLSAGLAHELNNPASAIERNASLLEDRLDDAERAARALGAARLSDDQLAALDRIREACLAKPPQGVRSPIEQAEREEALADWLAAHGLDEDAAVTLADTEVTFDALDALAAAVDGGARAAVVRWAAAGCAVRTLASEIQEAALRISGLVLAIKGYTHMDQAAFAEPVDLALSLTNTVAVLKSKARHKGASISLELDPDLPRVRGFVGELNQIWSNLIDNALDAIPGAGRVEVQARRERGRVVVRVIDNGTGIPAEIRDRIFDPFFTTKGVGQGSGIGLDIVRRLVVHNEGEVEVDSRPGRTEFRVALQPVVAAEQQA